MLTSEQFDRTRKLALRLAGIELCDRHRELLANRSRRLRIPPTAGIEALLGAAEEGDLPACRQVIGLVTTNFTGFFRHPRHFEVAAEHAFGAARRRGQARLWSAAAARGEHEGRALKAPERERRTRFFSESAGTTKLRLVPAVQRLVGFRALNLVDSVWPIEGQFDVLFCRNALMWSAPDIACAATSSECANRLPQRISL